LQFEKKDYFFNKKKIFADIKKLEAYLKQEIVPKRVLKKINGLHGSIANVNFLQQVVGW